MSGLEQALQEALRPHVSELFIRSVVSFAASRANASLNHLKAGDAKRLLAELSRGIRLYVSDVEVHAELVRRVSAALGEGGGRPMAPEVIDVTNEVDVVVARKRGADMCAELGFSPAMQVRIATIISELVRNIVQYAGTGSVTITPLSPRPGIEVLACDRGPGIDDINRVMSPSYKSKTGMGVGLRGTRSIVDEFEIHTAPGQGTTVRVRKYL